jgi:predicted O-methyltransferase YrrM
MLKSIQVHWLLHRMGLQKVRTHTRQVEHEVLERYVQGQRHIVELGVFEGASSLMLRKAMAVDGKLWCVDPFPRGRFGISYQYLIANREVNKSTNGTVGFVQKLSHEAVKGWQEPIDLLFIDADHSYQAVRRDWDDWSPYVKAGGIIALHDSRTLKYPGVLKLVKEITADEGAYRNVEEVATLTVFEKLANDIE